MKTSPYTEYKAARAATINWCGILATLALTSIAFLTMALVPSPPFQGIVTLQIQVPGPLNSTNRFVIVGSPDVSIPVTNWAVITNIAGNITNIDVNIPPSSMVYFFSAVETNKFGIGPFSPVAALELPRSVTTTIQAAR